MIKYKELNKDEKKLSSNIIIKKEVAWDSKPIYRAYFRETNNRAHYKENILVRGYKKKADLIYCLLNNSMERGVII